MAVIDLIRQALEEHGIGSDVDNEMVLLRTAAPLAFEARVLDGPPNDLKTIQLDIVTHSPRIAPRYIVESMAGAGRDVAAAESNAFIRFALSSLHVLLTVLADHACEQNPAVWLSWEDGEASWQVCDGPVVCHGTTDVPNIYDEFAKNLRTLLISSTSREVHWVSVFIGSRNGELTAVDIRLDNEPWPDAAALAHTIDWRSPDAYRSLRHFFIAIPSAR